MKKALCFFMAVVFVCCVISHGKDERFSVEAMITNLTNFEDMPSIEGLVDIWTQDFYIDTYASAGGESGGSGTLDTERTTFFEKVVGFFTDILAFLRKLWDSALYLCDMLISVLDNMQYLLPWNNTVPRGEW